MMSERNVKVLLILSIAGIQQERILYISGRDMVLKWTPSRAYLSVFVSIGLSRCLPRGGKPFANKFERL
jgi:hypothetical protein